MTRVTKKPEDRRAEIVKTARELFLKQDYSKTTMLDIMKILGIAKGTIYHYFKSKEDLLDAVINDIVDETIAQMEEIIKNSTGSVLETIEQLIKSGQIDNENQNLLEHLHRPENSTMHNRLLASTLIKQAPIYAQLIKKGCEEGIFKTQHPLECSEFILSGIQFLTDIGVYPWTSEDLKRRIQAFPQIIEQQLHAPNGSFNFLINNMKIIK